MCKKCTIFSDHPANSIQFRPTFTIPTNFYDLECVRNVQYFQIIQQIPSNSGQLLQSGICKNWSIFPSNMDIISRPSSKFHPIPANFYNLECVGIGNININVRPINLQIIQQILSNSGQLLQSGMCRNWKKIQDNWKIFSDLENSVKFGKTF